MTRGSEIVALLLMGVLAGCGRSAEDAAPEQLVATVQTAVVATQTFVDTVVATGVVAALPEGVHVVTPLYGGRVARLPVAVGARVRAGDVLAEIALDPTTVAEIGRLERARTAMERTVERQRQAFAAGVTARATLEAAEMDAANARAELTARTRSYDGRAKRVMLHAPVTGIVTALDVHDGQPVDPTTPVATILDPTALAVTVRVDGRSLAQVAVGQPAMINTVDDPTAPQAATVVRVAPGVDATAQEVEVWLRPAPPNALPGAFMRAVVQVGSTQQPAVPRVALVKTDAGYRLFTVAGDRAVAHDVTVGMLDDEKAAIRAGVAAGEVVVTDGAQELVDGMRIIVGPAAGDS